MSTAPTHAPSAAPTPALPQRSTMSSAAPAVSPDTEICRLTIVHPAGRCDVSVPFATPVRALLLALLRHLPQSPQERGTPQVLQRLGEEPLDPDGTPESLGLRHGDELHLRPADAALPALHFDDLADGVAHVISGRPDRWQPSTSRRLGLALAVLVLAALSASLLSADPGPFSAKCAGVITAVLLMTACVVASRADGDRGAVLIAALGALTHGALEGLALRAGPHGGFSSGPTAVLVAAGGVAVVAGVLLTLRPLPSIVPGTALLTALAGAAGAGLVHTLHWSIGQAAATVAVALFVLGHVGPRLALRLAGVRAPLLPHNAEELQQDITPEPQERVERRVTAANTYLNTLVLASAVVYAAAFLALAHESGWIGWVLPLVFSTAVLLRSRALTGVLQRGPMVVAGVLGLAVLLVRAGAGGTGDRVAVLAALLTATVLLMVWAPRLSGRLLPIWGHTGDVLELVAAIAVLPLLLQLLHVYAAIRALAG